MSLSRSWYVQTARRSFVPSVCFLRDQRQRYLCVCVIGNTLGGTHPVKERLEGKSATLRFVC